MQFETLLVHVRYLSNEQKKLLVQLLSEDIEIDASPSHLPRRGEGCLEIDGLVLDTARHRVTGHGKVINVSRTLFNLLKFFLENPQRALTRSMIIQAVWGDNMHIDARTVDVHIRRLRTALQRSGHEYLIETVRGKGYCLADPKSGQVTLHHSRTVGKLSLDAAAAAHYQAV